MKSYPTWLPYVLPLVLFITVTQFETTFGMHLYPFIYTLKIVIVGGVLFSFRRAYSEVRTTLGYIPVALLLGVLLCAMWVIIDRFTPHFAFLGHRASTDPWTLFPTRAEAILFLAVRFIGLVAIVPWMEEIFYRSFVLRYVINPTDFTKVPIGKFELTSCIVVVLFMTLSHPEWLAASIFSLTMNLLIYRTKSVFACIVTHGATNLALGIYVLITHSWQYW